jgi:hypothetical protein
VTKTKITADLEILYVTASVSLGDGSVDPGGPADLEATSSAQAVATGTLQTTAADPVDLAAGADGAATADGTLSSTAPSTQNVAGTGTGAGTAVGGLDVGAPAGGDLQKTIQIPQTGATGLIDDELDEVPAGNTVTISVPADSPLPVRVLTDA